MFFTKITFFVLCLSICLYQVIEISQSYLNYRTVTSVDYENNNLEMPAIYYCLPHPFTLREMLPYLNTTIEFSKNEFGHQNIDIKKIMSNLGINSNSTELFRKLEKKYKTLLENGKLKELLLDTSFIRDLNYNLHYVELTFPNLTKHELFNLFDFANETESMYLFDQIRTHLLFHGDKQKKCFSLFSKPEKNYSISMTTGSVFYIEVINANLMMVDQDGGVGSGLLITVVANNEVPKMADFTISDPFTVVDVKTTAYIIKRLESPYKTACFNYSFQKQPFRFPSVNKQSRMRIKSQSDCISKCIFGYMNPNSSEEINPILSTYLIDQDWVRIGQRIAKYETNFKLHDKIQVTAQKHCKSVCPPACEQVSFQMTVNHAKMKGDVTTFYLLPKASNIRISHQAEWSFLSYFGTVGGIVGVWFGESVYSFIKSMAFVWYYKKFKKGLIKLFQKCN